MNIDNIAKKRFQELLDKSTLIEKTKKTYSSGNSQVNNELFEEWVVSVSNLFSNLLGEDSVHYKQYLNRYHSYRDHYTIGDVSYDIFTGLRGILKAAKEDYESGYIFKATSLLRAEIFSDFLEMGEYLLNEGYKDAAAVIIGSVLEDSLRKIATNKGLPIIKPDGKFKTIEPLNMDLATAGVYDKLIQKQVTSWGDLRNKAAHGNYSEYDKEQVKMMLLFVQKFCSDFI